VTPGATTTPEQLARAVEQVVHRVAHWTAQRWTATGAAAPVHALIQRLADLGAATEGRPTRPVPRLDNDLSLPDQLTVVTVDLLAASPPAETLSEALAAVQGLRLER